MIRQYSAGGVVYKKKDGQVLWLMIQPEGNEHWSKERWQLPKGMIELGEKAPQTAVREVEEETGVKAIIIDDLDPIRIFFFDEEKNRILKTITFFLMEYVGKGKRLEDGEKINQVLWLAFEKAMMKLTFKSEKAILDQAQKLLNHPRSQELLL